MAPWSEIQLQSHIETRGLWRGNNTEWITILRFSSAVVKRYYRFITGCLHYYPFFLTSSRTISGTSFLPSGKRVLHAEAVLTLSFFFAFLVSVLAVSIATDFSLIDHLISSRISGNFWVCYPSLASYLKQSYYDPTNPCLAAVIFCICLPSLWTA